MSCRSIVPAFVGEGGFGYRAAFTARRYRSIVAPDIDSSSSRRRRGIVLGTPRRFAAALNCRREFALDQPVTAMTRSRISPLRFFAALAYSSPCLFVISRRASIDNSPIPQGHRAQPGPGQHFREHP
jgi:hypothetical protein